VLICVLDLRCLEVRVAYLGTDSEHLIDADIDADTGEIDHDQEPVPAGEGAAP
jgi:hypothetical protein